MNKRWMVSVCVLIVLGCGRPVEETPGMVRIKANQLDFEMDVSPVTVREFRAFVEATGYVTEAEKFGDSGVFDFATGQWNLLPGANWKHPLGPDGGEAQEDHPVTQVSWNDAQAYCTWAGKRLPTSEEFLLAERNGRSSYDHVYTWGDDFVENGIYKANFWQGTFPIHNSVDDGFLTTSPVGYFGKNKLGLTDMGGNVWQWCSDDSAVRPGEKNQRAGSFLCDPSVCHGFKVGGVASSSPETSLMHVGFRAVK